MFLGRVLWVLVMLMSSPGVQICKKKDFITLEIQGKTINNNFFIYGPQCETFTFLVILRGLSGSLQ